MPKCKCKLYGGMMTILLVPGKFGWKILEMFKLSMGFNRYSWKLWWNNLDSMEIQGFILTLPRDTTHWLTYINIHIIKNIKYIHSSYEKHGVLWLRRCSGGGSSVGCTCKERTNHECSVAILQNSNLMRWTKKTVHVKMGWAAECSAGLQFSQKGKVKKN